MQHILQQARRHGARTAIRTPTSEVSYGELCARSLGLSKYLLNKENNDSLSGQRVAFMCDRNASYVIAQWAVWASGGIAVPLHPGHPTEEIQYVLNDSACSKILTDSKHLATVEAASNLPVQLVEESLSMPSSDFETLNPQNFSPDKMAQIIYTSGTTGKPKGAVISHKNLSTQIGDLVQSWEITEDDKILHFLPLHHVHGILNKLLVPLYAGGTVYMLPSSKPQLVWDHLGDATILQAVPTVYSNLVEWYDEQPPDEQAKARQKAANLRLCVSGSMSCPVSLIARWEEITGHRLLERYGMTELGMVLTNLLHGKRFPGYVGKPFPSVQVKVLGSSSNQNEGELLVKGDTVFDSYWGKPEATKDAFDERGWFKTGDLVEYSPEKKSFRILGRMSVDILKVGGYKLSAVEIEAAVLGVDCVAECYVVGAPDKKRGQVVVAVVRLKQPDMDHNVAQTLISEHTQNKLANYKLPRIFVFLESIPKNPMGKVNKKVLLDEMQEQGKV